MVEVNSNREMFVIHGWYLIEMLKSWVSEIVGFSRLEILEEKGKKKKNVKKHQ